MADSAATPSVEELVLKHAQDVYRYAYRLCGSPVEAEDLTQETFLAAVAHLHQLAKPDSAKSWLFKILRNQFLLRARKNAGTTVQTLGDSIEAFSGPAEHDSDVDSELVQQVLDGLPWEQRIVLLMFYFEEASYKEIAEELGIPIGTVMSRLSRAKEAFRKRLMLATHKGG